MASVVLGLFSFFLQLILWSSGKIPSSLEETQVFLIWSWTLCGKAEVSAPGQGSVFGRCKTWARSVWFQPWFSYLWFSVDVKCCLLSRWRAVSEMCVSLEYLPPPTTASAPHFQWGYKHKRDGVVIFSRKSNLRQLELAVLNQLASIFLAFLVL